MKIQLLLFVLATATLPLRGLCQQLDSILCTDDVFWMRYEEYDPYSWLNLVSIPMRVTKTCTPCLEKVEYSYQGVSGPKSNKITLTFNRCNPDASIYELDVVFFASFFPEIPYFCAPLKFMDSLNFLHHEKTYTIKKYKAEMLKGEFITLYYNDSIGIIKQYGSYRSINSDNIAPLRDLLTNTYLCEKRSYVH